MQREFSRSSLLHAAVPSGLLGRVCTAGGPLSVNFAQGCVVLRGREVSVTRIEKELLNVFLTHETIPNQAICLPRGGMVSPFGEQVGSRVEDLITPDDD